MSQEWPPAVASMHAPLVGAGPSALGHHTPALSQQLPNRFLAPPAGLEPATHGLGNCSGGREDASGGPRAHLAWQSLAKCVPAGPRRSHRGSHTAGPVPSLTLLAALWSDDLESRKVRAVARRIAGEQDQAGDRGMGADVEVRQRGSTPAAASPIADEALPGEEARFPRQGKSQEVRLRESVLEILNPLESDRNLGIDERIDREGGSLGAFGEGLLRPGGPFRVFREDVEQDVAVDENGQRLLRVRARISSVVILTEPRPRSRCTIDFPRRPTSLARRTLRIRTACPTSSNSTSELGNRPSFSRISTGMVTWPFVVILIVLPHEVILARKDLHGQKALVAAASGADVLFGLRLEDEAARHSSDQRRSRTCSQGITRSGSSR